jgi:4-diphosphocytidyl-2-C-methyl-D-erythritol kinase
MFDVLGDPIDGFEVARLKQLKSSEILKTIDASGANDLFLPAMQEYKELKKYYKHGYYFSGSGSSFFKIKDKSDG